MTQEDVDKSNNDVQNYRLDGLEALLHDVKQHIESQDDKIEDIGSNLVMVKAKLYNGMSEAIITLVSNQSLLLVQQAKHDVAIRGMLWVMGVVVTSVVATALKVWL